ncbi:MAG: acyl-CoA desaturase [Pseudomonadota bacterium]
MNYDALERDLEHLKEDTLSKVGEKDARYIRRIEKLCRFATVSGRVLLMLSWFPPCWLLGTLLLALGKILENMELGHNIMHGQYNFMNDPRFNGLRYEWDIAGSANNWRQTHNYSHHTYTNVQSKDHDIGYSVLRLFKEQKWHPTQLFQTLYTVPFALLFQWGVAIQNLRIGRLFLGRISLLQLYREQRPAFSKVGQQLLKDYVFFPLIAGPMFLHVLLGNFVANIIRNVWTFSIIFCGHFTKNVKLFDKSILKNESKGQWYYRQILGSSNIQGNRWFHILSGNLSHQIEHHLFPDMPSYRYPMIAPKVRAICEKHGIYYNTGGFIKQFSQVLGRIVRYSFP